MVARDMVNTLSQPRGLFIHCVNTTPQTDTPPPIPPSPSQLMVARDMVNTLSQPRGLFIHCVNTTPPTPPPPPPAIPHPVPVS